MKNTHTVIVVLEAKDGKTEALKKLLLSVVEPSRSEKTCIEYKLHQDINKPSKFILYEIWIDAEAHALQFQKPYILNLSNQIGDLLAAPYQAYFANEVDFV